MGVGEGRNADNEAAGTRFLSEFSIEQRQGMERGVRLNMGVR